MGETKERPIRFSGPMVRALLEGRKTQTRRFSRVVSPAGQTPSRIERGNELRGGPASASGNDWAAEYEGGGTMMPGARWQRHAIACPYGQPGDRLWMREKYRVEQGGRVPSGHKAVELSYPANGAKRWFFDDEKPEEYPLPESRWGRGFPSIHLPRWASRLTLEVTKVRVQRLHEISEEDAKAEGVVPAPFCKAGRPNGQEHVEAFENLWISINGAGAWNANPLVWTVSFRVVTP